MVATIGEDGLPHVVPVEVLVADDKVYVWTRARSRKVANVAHAGIAALTAYKGNDFVLVRGRARVLDATDPSYEQLARSFLRKYDRDETFGNDRLIEILPEKISFRG